MTWTLELATNDEAWKLRGLYLRYLKVVETGAKRKGEWVERRKVRLMRTERANMIPKSIQIS